MCSAVVRLVVVTFLAGMLQAAPAPISLKWNELSGEIFGTTTGVVLGLLVGSMVGIAGSGAGAVGVTASAPVAGYFIGRSADRQESVITILPD